MSVPEQLFKVSLHLAKFCELNILDIRKVEFKEILYLYNSLVSYDFEDVKQVYQQGEPVAKKPRKVYADQVDWFD